MRQFRFAMLVALLAVAAAASAQEAAKAPAVLLRASFDESANADEAKGAKEAEISEGVKLVAGRKGKALYVGQGERCVYRREGNLKAEAGTVHFWFSPGRDFKHQANPDDDRNLFTTPATSVSLICLYINNGVWPLAILRDKPKSKCYSLGTKRQAWKKDEWHHFCLTWDQTEVAFYVDGTLAQKRALDFVLGVGETIDLGWRRIGDKSIECADGAFDDLVILDGPLTAEQVAAIGKAAEVEAKAEAKP